MSLLICCRNSLKRETRAGSSPKFQRNCVKASEKVNKNKSKVQQKTNSKQAASQKAKCRRKALTRALNRLRATSRDKQKPKKKSHCTVRLSVPVRRILRSRISSPEKQVIETPRLRPRQPATRRSKMDYDLKENDPERERSPSVVSNARSPSPESEIEKQSNNDDDLSDTESDTDSSSDFQMQVLEKQVESEKEPEEEDDDCLNVPLSLLDDSDDTASLLSPSALPASQVFRPTPIPVVRRQKRKSTFEGDLNERSESSPYSSPFLYHSPSSSASTSAALKRATSSYKSSSLSPIGALPGKRGRGRPRKALEDIKSVSGIKYRKKLGERLIASGSSNKALSQSLYSNYELDLPQQNMFDYSPPSNVFDDFMLDQSSHHNQMEELYSDPTTYQTELDDNQHHQPENSAPRQDRWKDRSTFVYAKHKFVSHENKFKCNTCQVSFTALSSLKRHYGTIYHKQQEAAGRSTLDLSDILRPDRDGNMPLSPDRPSSASSSFHQPGRGRGRPPLARTTSFVQKSAVCNIKKYYAARDAARIRRQNHSAGLSSTNSRGIGSTWVQKHQRKRKPLVHSDYLYTSASPESEMDMDDVEDEENNDKTDFGCEDEENIENNSPDNGTDQDSEFGEFGHAIRTPWLSNVWKGIGPAHFTCEVCGEKFSKKFEFTAHLFDHRHEESRRLSLTCPDCQSMFPNEPLLEHHFNLFNHGVGVVKDGRPTNTTNKLTCSKCNSKFTRKDYYRKHLEVHKRPLTKCPHCPKKFLYKFYLSDHIKAKHDDSWSNNLTNSVNTNGNIASDVAPIIAANPNLSNATTVNQASSATNNIPKPKIELYSSSTLIFTPNETNKRKNSNFSGGTCETFESTPSTAVAAAGKKKNSSSSTTESSRDIPVPNFITCDPFTESDDKSKEYPEGDDDDGVKAIAPAPIQVPLVLSPKEELCKATSVNMLQKFFDSQNEHQVIKDHEKYYTDSKNQEEEEEENEHVDCSKEILLSQLGGIDHSTTEDGKIVFQLEGFSTVGDDPDSSCSMEPLTIEIARDNLNMDGEQHNDPDYTNEEKSTCEEEASVPEVEKEKSPVVPHISSPEETTAVIPAAEMVTETEQEPGTPVDPLEFSNPCPPVPLSTSSSSSFQIMGCGVKINLSVTPNPENELQCQDCGKIYEHKKSLIKHVRYYNQVESYPCTLCDKSFKLKHHVTRHIKSFHNIETCSTTSSASDDMALEEHVEDISSFLAADIEPIRLPLPSPSSSSITSSSETAGPSKPAAPPKRSLSTSEKPAAPERKRTASGSTSGKSVDSTKSCQTPISPILLPNPSYTVDKDGKGQEVFKCLICTKVYPSKPQLRSHLSYHRRSNRFKCPSCPQEFKNKPDLDAHRSQHEKLACDKCPNRLFSLRKDLLRHQREKHHHLGRKPIGMDGVDSQVWICPLCPLVFPQDTNLQKHIAKEHNKTGALVCRRCGQIWASVEALKKHLLNDHQIVDVEETSGQHMKPILIEDKGHRMSPVKPVLQKPEEPELEEEPELLDVNY